MKMKKFVNYFVIAPLIPLFFGAIILLITQPNKNVEGVDFIVGISIIVGISLLVFISFVNYGISKRKNTNYFMIQDNT